MDKDVIVSSTNGKTKVEISPFKMVVKFDEDNLEIIFDGAKNNKIAIKGNTQMLIDGDFYIASAGEIGIMTEGENINFDSIGAQVHLNSRISKPLLNLPESILYRENIEKEQDKKILDNNQNLTKYFNNTIDELRERIKDLENDRVGN